MPLGSGVDARLDTGRGAAGGLVKGELPRLWVRFAPFSERAQSCSVAKYDFPCTSHDRPDLRVSDELFESVAFAVSVVGKKVVCAADEDFGGF